MSAVAKKKVQYHRSEPIFVRKFLTAFKNNRVKETKGEEGVKAYKKFVADMQKLGEYSTPPEKRVAILFYDRHNIYNPEVWNEDKQNRLGCISEFLKQQYQNPKQTTAAALNTCKIFF